jgi:hypothetical protein
LGFVLVWFLPFNRVVNFGRKSSVLHLDLLPCLLPYFTLAEVIILIYARI